MALLQMSMSAAVLIFIVILVRAVLIHKLPKKAFMLLWGVALFRLLIPVSIPSVFSIYTWILKSDIPYVSEQANHFDIQRLSAVSDTVIENVTKNSENQGLFHLSDSLWEMLWIIGFLLCVLYFVMAYRRGMKKFKNSLPIEAVFIMEWKEKHPLKRTLSIYSSDQVFTPLSYGILRPVILLPRNLDFDNTKALNYILTHEYVHIRHFDVLTKMLMILALCIHWFNPMVWVMFLLINRDIELVCDETVVKLFGERSRISYANILIDMEIRKSEFVPLCSSFSRNLIEERIGAIMKMKKMTIFSLGFAGILVAGVTMLFVTSAKLQENSSAFESQYNTVNRTDLLTYENQIQTENAMLTTGEGAASRKEQASASEYGNTLSPDELEELYSVYKPFGLIYDKSEDCFYYKGKLVREFIDVMQSNGESLSGGKFKGTIRQIENPKGEGDVVISTIRDYEKKDKSGDGILLGIKEGY